MAQQAHTPSAASVPTDAGSPAAVPLVALSELAEEKITREDLLTLLPAAGISIVFNVLLVFVLLWYNAGSARATVAVVTVPEQEETVLEERDKMAIDPEFSPLEAIQVEPAAPEEMGIPSEIPVAEPPPDPANLGVGGKEGSGVKGLGTSDTGAIIGMPGLGEFGFRGSAGSNPAGEGFGLPGGISGGRDSGGFGLRLDVNNRMKYVRLGGGNDASERAVVNGLNWFVRHQAPDGRWSLHQYHRHGGSGCNCRDPGTEAYVENNDTAATALGLLPFLGAGHTHKRQGPYQKHVLAALNYLIRKQDGKGDLGGGMYAHGLATIALCEAYGLAPNDKVLRAAAQRAIYFIVSAQNPNHGGWRYQARSADGDTSVVGWQVMALRSGQMAGLEVPSRTLELASKWLDSCAKDKGAKYSYVPTSGASPAMTAAALLNRQYLGQYGPRTPELHQGCKYLLTNLPPEVPKNPGAARPPLGGIYYYYYATQVLHHMEGDYWQKWNPRMRDFLIATQETSGHKAGSWDPAGSDYGGRGGRIYTTSLAVLTLEVYYRYLPLYRRTAASMEMATQMPEKDRPAPDSK